MDGETVGAGLHRTEITVVNVSPAVMIVQPGKRWVGAFGEGHLVAGQQASLFIAAGVNAKALSTYLGHSSVTITYDRYGHLMPGNEAEAVALVDAFLDRAVAPTAASG